MVHDEDGRLDVHDVVLLGVEVEPVVEEILAIEEKTETEEAEVSEADEVAEEED